MGFKLSDVRERETQETLREIARATHKPSGKVLAVCETSTGEYVLAREIAKSAKGPDGKADAKLPKVRTLKRSALLADFSHALAIGLIEE